MTYACMCIKLNMRPTEHVSDPVFGCLEAPVAVQLGGVHDTCVDEEAKGISFIRC